MATIIEVVERAGPPRRGPPSLQSPAASPPSGLGWIPIALGTAVVVVGLGSRKRRTVPIALTAFAGGAAVAAMRDVPRRGNTDRQEQRGASGGKLEAERSITVGRTADELRECWLDPTTLPQITAGFATVRASGNGRTHWKVDGPLGHTLEWDSETVNDGPGGAIGWRSLPDASIANDGSVRFHRAPVGRGTVVTLHLRFDPPGGALGNVAAKILGTMPLDLAADGALRRFKSLIETGEIPTTDRQPAARPDTR